jgi:acetyltransferase-like isoleucine patch superfamily enzyme
VRHSIAAIRAWYYRFKFALLRKDVSIGKGLKAYKQFEIMGEGRVRIGRNCLVSGMAGEKNQYVTIYTHSPNANVLIGDNVVLVAAKLACKFEVVIGDDVLIEDASILDTDFHSIRRERFTEPVENIDKCRIRIGNRVSIGARSIIAKGVTIGDDVLIGPGSVVNRSVPSNTCVIGNPAKTVNWPAI